MRQPLLFRQADRRQRTSRAEVFVFGDGRPLDTAAEFARPLDRGLQVAAGRLVDFDEGGHAIGVVADAGLGDRLAEALFQEDGVGDGLDAIAGPGLGMAVVVAAAPPALVLDGHPCAVAAAHGVHFAEKAPALAGDFQRALFGRFIVGRGDLDVQSPAGVDGGVGHANFLDLFQIEKPLAVEQGVQSHDPQGRFGLASSLGGATTIGKMVGLDRLVFLWQFSQYIDRLESSVLMRFSGGCASLVPP